MKGFLDKFINQKQQLDVLNKIEDLEHQVAALYSLACDVFGADRMVIKATKLRGFVIDSFRYC